jgi:hypothetical protein
MDDWIDRLDRRWSDWIDALDDRLREWIAALGQMQRGALAVATTVVVIGVATALFPVTARGIDRTTDCGSAILAANDPPGAFDPQWGDCRDAGRGRVAAGLALVVVGVAGGAVGVALFASPEGASSRRPEGSTGGGGNVN